MYQSELKVALEAAQRASAAILQKYADFQAIPQAPASITTDVDRLAQEIVLHEVHQAFPGDALCAEETTAAGTQVTGTGPRLWIVDPIDGTRGFARKNGEFSVMIGFVQRGAIAVGVVHEPALSRLTYAVRGGGCWRQDAGASAASRCRVSRTSDLGQAALVQSRSRDPNTPTPQVKALGPARVIETYSAGVKLAKVARGEADIYVNNYQNFHDWDICAGHILVTEAGGKVTGLAGQELHYGLEGAWQRNGLLGTNGLLHEAALARLKTAGYTARGRI